MDVLRLALIGLALGAGCAADLPATAEWVPAALIDGALAPELGEAPAVAASPRAAGLGPVRVVSYNLAKAPDVDAFARVLADDPALARAGVFIVQEIESYPGEGGCRAARLAGALGLNYGYAPAFEVGGGTHGQAIFSAFPIANLEVMHLSEADVPLTGAPRIAIQADLDLGDGVVLHVVGLHLDTTLNVGERLFHLRPAVIDQPDPVIVAGDFNMNAFAWAGDLVPLPPAGSAVDTDQAPVVDEFMANLGFAAPTAALGPTEVHLGIESRLDSIYVRGLASVGAGVERAVELSDHFPLWLDLDR